MGLRKDTQNPLQAHTLTTPAEPHTPPVVFCPTEIRDHHSPAGLRLFGGEFQIDRPAIRQEVIVNVIDFLTEPVVDLNTKMVGYL